MEKKKEYNEEPIEYCGDCLSLKIIDACGVAFCDSCNSTNIHKSYIDIWETMYKQKYGFKFLNRYYNGRENKFRKV